jgi:hypothetical protein
MSSEVFSGARCMLTINGQQVGFARSASYSVNINYEPVKVLGNIEVQEHVATSYNVQFSVGSFNLVGGDVVAEGLMPAGGQSSDERLLNILTSGELTAVFECKKTNRTIARVEGLKLATDTVTMDASTAVGEDTTFVAKRVLFESEIS